MVWWLWVAVWVAAGAASPLPHEVDSEQTRKLLGSSVVTSVSVIMDHGNGTKTYLTDGQAERKPAVVGTPGTLLSPDRYEFYSFGEDGELVKKLMTLDQIQSLIAGGDELDPLPVYYPQPLVDSSSHTDGVHKVLESVQNVLKGELQAVKDHHKVPPPLPPMPDESWSILLPGLLNSDLDFKEPHIPIKTTPVGATTSKPHHQSTNKLPSGNVKKPPTTVTKPATPRPTANQSTVPHRHTTVVTSTTTQQPESTITKKPTDTKYTYHSTVSPHKTTSNLVTKPQNQKPHITTKRPFVSTKKPYISDSPYVKIPLTNLSKVETSTKSSTTSKKPVAVEERIPNTKFPDTKKPPPEKQKPSGIPTITHYLPISSLSPSNSTQKVSTPAVTESAVNNKITTPAREPTRVTPTKRPTTTTAHHSTVQKPTRKPVQNKVPVANNKPPVNKIQNDKKRPTTPATIVTKNKTTTTAPTITTTKGSSTTFVPKNNSSTFTMFSTSTEKLEIPSTTNKVIIATTMKNPNVPSAEKLILEKQPLVKPQNNLVGDNSNLIHTKVKPSEEAALSSTTITLPKITVSTTSGYTTPLPEKITTFSYTSKITPNGEIITHNQPISSTTQHKFTTETSLTPTISSQKVTTAYVKTTEKPQVKVTLATQESQLTKQDEREHILVSSSQQPTTYHPQNFSIPSKKPAVLSSTTPVSSTMMKITTISQPQKTTVVSTTPPVEIPTQTLSSMMKTPLSTASSTVSTLTTSQDVTKPTTIDSAMDETTVGVTTPNLNVSTEVIANESTTYSTEEMPLQEIPLRIYESLKDHANGAQDIMTTIMSDSFPTTPGKLENTFSTNNEEITVPSTTTVTDKATTIQDLLSSTSSGTSNKVVIINNSEPQFVEMSSTEPINKVESESKTNPTESLHTTIIIPLEQKNSTANNNISFETTTYSTAIPANSSDQENVETTPNLDSTTIYKDQVVQEGISAVTSILLDEAQKQQVIKEAMLVAALKSSENKDMERVKTTTENEQAFTTLLDTTEISTDKYVTDRDQMKSEVRLNEDAELPEKLTTTTGTIETTTAAEKLKPESTKTKHENKENNNESNKQVFKKHDQKITMIAPTKESKLNPESDINEEKLNKKPEVSTTESTPMLRTSAVPHVVATTERQKLSELEKSAPKPVSPFAKKPNPGVYQSLESLPSAAVELHPAPYESMGLEASVAFLGEDVRRFADLCNELAFKLWTSITGKGQIASRSLVMSPFAVTSLLAMVFLGARGPTSGQMNDVLRLDDMVTFNPHQVLQNVTESVINSKNHGVATAAFVRELYSDKTKGKILDFYKERVQQYYQGHVEEVTFTTIGDIIRRRTNLLVKRQTLGKVAEYLRGSSLNMRPPLAAFSANIFQTDCEDGSTEGRDGEMYFVVRPSTRQRRLVPVPAVVWRAGFLAGYEPSLDATSVCLQPESVVSTILILPGQQGQVAPGDGLARLEQRLIETSYRRGSWSQLLRSLMPRPGLELQIPRFSHRSVLNVTGALQRMGLRDLFSARRADLRGLNGLSNDLHLSDMVQVNTFSTCGEETIGARHHVETYPASPQRMGREREPGPPRDWDTVFSELPASHRPRQARLPDNPRLRFDRPFLYMVRHNPSGMVLHMGRFNPRLLP